MKTKIFHGESRIVEAEINSFLNKNDIGIIDIKMSTCSVGQAFTRSILTVLILYRED